MPRKDFHTMEIRVNVINEMKKLRSNTYSDRYAWVDELIQNCQRAKATHIDVDVDEYNRTITVSDNGIGCDDPRYLFDKSSSGWDQETTKNESPFGEGFFSTMLAANTITVKSKGFTAIFDVNRMFEENNPDVIEIHPNKKQSGFIVTLSDLLDHTYTWQIIDRFKNVGKYIKSPTMTINGERVHYEGLNPNTESPFVRKIDNDFFKGWIRPHAWQNGDWDDAMIKCFAFNRHVKDSKKYSGVFGVLNFKPGAVDLRCPDRKEFIFNEKYDAMCNVLHDEIEKMYINVIKNGTDEEIKNFEYNIRKYTDMDNLKRFVKFKFIASDGDDEKLNNLLAVSEKTDDEDDNVSTDTETYDEPFDTVSNENVSCENDFVIEKVIPKKQEIKETPKPTRKKRNVLAQTGTVLSDKLAYAFYIGKNDTGEYEDQIKMAKKNNVPLIEIRNGLEQTILESDERFHPISDMNSLLKTRAEFRNMVPCSIPEMRISKLLMSMADRIGVDKNTFVIADTKFNKILVVNDKEHIVTELDQMATAYNGKIYIDRKYLKSYSDLKDDSESITPEDIKFLLLNLDIIASELSHAIKNTTDNTLIHANTKSEYMMQIISLIYNNKATIMKPNMIRFD